MKETIAVDMGGRKSMPIDVELLDDAERMTFISRYPGGGIDPSAKNISPATLDWFVDVTTRSTRITEGELRRLSQSDMLELCAEVTTTALAVEDTNNSRSGPDHVPSDDWMVVSK